MIDAMLRSFGAVLAAPTPEAASRAFFAAAQPLGATYLQTRRYRRPRGTLTPAAHLAAGGVVARVAPPSWEGSAAYRYVCIDCNPLVDAIRLGLTRYAFSDFAPHGRAFGAYWEAMGEAGIADAVCAASYGRGRQVASLHLGLATAVASAAETAQLQLGAALLVERLMHFDDDGDAPPQPALSRRERDALSFVGEGKTDWEIGTIMGVSEVTARFHVDNARRKLGAVNRAQAVAKLVAGGLD